MCSASKCVAHTHTHTPHTCTRTFLPAPGHFVPFTTASTLPIHRYLSTPSVPTPTPSPLTQPSHPHPSTSPPHPHPHPLTPPPHPPPHPTTSLPSRTPTPSPHHLPPIPHPHPLTPPPPSHPQGEAPAKGQPRFWEEFFLLKASVPTLTACPTISLSYMLKPPCGPVGACTVNYWKTCHVQV